MTSSAGVEELNERHGLAGIVRFRQGPGGLLFADVHNALARASVCLQGGQLTQWQPHGQAWPVLWLSDAARYAPATAIRGGIPVCWPWFGSPDARQDPQAGPLPAHGFARTRTWQVDSAQPLAGGATRLGLQLTDDAQTRALWPPAFALELQITIGATLALSLTTRNISALPLRITEALHTYFRIGDIGSIAVQGLAGAPYFDALADSPVVPGGRRQDGAVRFAGEVDRIYHSSAACRIDDPLLGRRLHIAKSGSASTVVWNPWEAKALRLGDMGPGGWRQMVCVESANAREGAVVVDPGASHSLEVRYGVEA